MKNIKCVIGATLLAPIFFVVFAAVCGGIVWLTSTFKIAEIIMLVFSGVFFLGFLVTIWCGIYQYCVEHHE